MGIWESSGYCWCSPSITLLVIFFALDVSAYQNMPKNQRESLQNVLPELSGMEQIPAAVVVVADPASQPFPHEHGDDGGEHCDDADNVAAVADDETTSGHSHLRYSPRAGGDADVAAVVGNSRQRFLLLATGRRYQQHCHHRWGPWTKVPDGGDADGDGADEDAVVEIVLPLELPMLAMGTYHDDH